MRARSPEVQEAAFEPTEEQRRLVRAFSGFGVTQKELARHLGIEPSTLRRHFQEELDRGALETTARVAQSPLRMATTGKNAAAATFWPKAWAGWREKQQAEHTGELPYVSYTGVPRGDSVPDAALERIAALGQPGHAYGDTDPRTHRPDVVGDQPELTVEEWIRTYGRGARDETAA
jgi:AraC-like DNA-binding protein